MAKSKQDKFWKDFAQSYWEKKPLLVKKFNSSVGEINQAQIFSMLVDYSDRCRKLKLAKGFKLYINGQLQYEADVLQFLPLKKDKSLQGYHARMEKDFSDYCLVCDELLQVSQNNWKNLQEFADNLFAYVGFPNRFMEMGLYLGNYRKTPFGVHVDGCGVFSFPVIGQKTFRLWKPDFAAKNPTLDRTHNYTKFTKHSEVLKAKAGDMTYWPSSAWHIAESDGSFNATWSLGVWVDQTHQISLEKALKPLMKAKLGALGQLTTTHRRPEYAPGELSELPKTYKASIQIIKNLSCDELHDTFMKAWLTLNSKQGFKNSPISKKNSKLSLKSKVQLKNAQLIHWSKLKNLKIIYAFQGQTYETNYSNNIVNLVKDLNLGKMCTISDYLKGASKNADFQVVQALSHFGAF